MCQSSLPGVKQEKIMGIKGILVKIRHIGNPDRKATAKKMCQTVFGVGEKPNPKKYLKSPDLDEVEVAAALARIETEIAWLKRLIWVGAIGLGINRIIGG